MMGNVTFLCFLQFLICHH